jgi:hypothetical protein
MKKLFLLMILSGFVFAFSTEVKNPDKPAKGDWDFKLKKIWEIDHVGENIFARLSEPQVSNEGNILVRDSKVNKTYIFSADGKFVKFFAIKGEGPGEIRTHFQAYLVGDTGTFVIADFDRLHYFKTDGTFVKTVTNTFFRRRPVFFIDDDEFIASPLNVFRSPDKKGAIRKVNLKTGTDTLISEFQIFTGGSINRQGGSARLIIIVGLSPMMTVGRGTEKIYYGVSDAYKINVVDLDGKSLFAFSVNRKNKKISKEEKKELFAGIKNMPENERKQLIKNFPDEPTHFYHIEEIDGLIYVFVPDPLRRFEGHQQPKQIDIFSPDGKYLYKTNINVEKGWRPESLMIKKNNLYSVLQNGDGDIKLVKYQISLPKIK